MLSLKTAWALCSDVRGPVLEILLQEVTLASSLNWALGTFVGRFAYLNVSAGFDPGLQHFRGQVFQVLPLCSLALLLLQGLGN